MMTEVLIVVAVFAIFIGYRIMKSKTKDRSGSSGRTKPRPPQKTGK
jgi:hypothetical protein